MGPRKILAVRAHGTIGVSTEKNQKGLTICHSSQTVQSTFSDGNPISNPTPPQTHPNWSGQPVCPNVGAAGCGLVGAAGGVFGLRPRGSGFALAARCMNSYYTIRIKKCMNWYKNHTVYELVLYNLYKNYCIKISEKKIFIRGWDFNPGPKWLAIVAAPGHSPSSSVSAHFTYIPYNKNTIRKSGLYGLTRIQSHSTHNLDTHIHPVAIIRARRVVICGDPVLPYTGRHTSGVNESRFYIFLFCRKPKVLKKNPFAKNKS